MDTKVTVRLQCPTCGSTQFESDDEGQKQQLVNGATSEVKKELQRTLRSAFRGSKFIKVK